MDTELARRPVMQPYSSAEPPRAEIDATKGSLLLEFGSNGCGICRATQPLLVEALEGREALQHIRVEDGRGRPLGRSFRVKLWPTLIFLKGGEEVARLVRPETVEAIHEALALI
jgi:thioredoxin 1